MRRRACLTKNSTLLSRRSIAGFFPRRSIAVSNVAPRCRNKLAVRFSRRPINSPSSPSLSYVKTASSRYPLSVEAPRLLRFIAEASNSLHSRYVYKCAPLYGWTSAHGASLRPFFSDIKQCKIHSVPRRAAAKASRRRRRRAPSLSAVMYSRFPSHSFFIAVARRIRISRRENLTHTYATKARHAKTHPTAPAHGGKCYAGGTGRVGEGDIVNSRCGW